MNFDKECFTRILRHLSRESTVIFDPEDTKKYKKMKNKTKKR